MAEFNLGCQNNDFDHTYKVYVTTFLGFGANEAQERYEEGLIQQAMASQQKTSELVNITNRYMSAMVFKINSLYKLNDIPEVKSCHTI